MPGGWESASPSLSPKAQDTASVRCLPSRIIPSAQLLRSLLPLTVMSPDGQVRVRTVCRGLQNVCGKCLRKKLCMHFSLFSYQNDFSFCFPTNSPKSMRICPQFPYSSHLHVFLFPTPAQSCRNAFLPHITFFFNGIPPFLSNPLASPQPGVYRSLSQPCGGSRPCHLGLAPAGSISQAGAG